ncbi:MULTISPECIES: DUF4384 domain-containing protein [Planktothrix]|uniref:DUF4384 domain-containing protein n=1 Tax=Planktothrix rubescens CCAP 1459/22 TaxID=329571 RepID=A0A6J7ZPA2_PLARU|nr:MULTISPECIES: DUF4384 domain-containing protein [Planktothrix]CAC5344350.1 hypothetical protein PLAN_40765 [Planktothrix rubescens NIVA-CYA 18]CAD5915690.1 hypothetical protein PCC7821_00328 [Planktothrix rubescens NIVA-CYA 18]
MVIANIPDDQVFAEAAQYWNLPQLYADLAIANAKELTSVQKKYLRGLLLGYSPDYIADKVHSQANSVRVTLSKDVYPAIRQLCDIDSVQWGQVTTLLEKYRITLTLEQVWQDLEQLATQTDKMYPVAISSRPQVQGLDWTMDEQPETKFKVKLGDKIKFEINLEVSGYLTLLQRGTSGKVICCCPSPLATDIYLINGKTILPQPQTGKSAIPITGSYGTDKFLALITPQPLTLTWLKQGSEKFLSLTVEHLLELQNNLNPSNDYQLFCSEYLIIA